MAVFQSNLKDPGLTKESWVYNQNGNCYEGDKLWAFQSVSTGTSQTPCLQDVMGQSWETVNGKKEVTLNLNNTKNASNMCNEQTRVYYGLQAYPNGYKDVLYLNDLSAVRIKAAIRNNAATSACDDDTNLECHQHACPTDFAGKKLGWLVLIIGIPLFDETNQRNLWLEISPYWTKNAVYGGPADDPYQSSYLFGGENSTEELKRIKITHPLINGSIISPGQSAIIDLDILPLIKSLNWGKHYSIDWNKVHLTDFYVGVETWGWTYTRMTVSDVDFLYEKNTLTPTVMPSQTSTPTPNTQNQQLVFSPSLRADWAHIDRSGTSDYEPTALDDGQWRVWHCGNDIINREGGDSIFYTSFKTDGSYDQSTTPVLRRTGNDLSEDGQGACSPSVIKHNTGLFEKAQDYYLMYYECAKRFYPNNLDNYVSGGFTQICHAISEDGINWRKWNRDLWQTSHKYGEENTDPSPVVTVSDTIINNCKLQNPSPQNGNKYRASFPGNNQDCSDAVNNYGVGHPSVIYKDGYIWLYYYDSTGNWSTRGVYRVKSTDGFNFNFAQKEKTNLTNPIKVKYLKMPINGYSGVYLGTLGLMVDNYFAYSYDGLNWIWSDPYCPVGASFPYCFPKPGTESLKIGPAISTHCVAPGYAGIISDVKGMLNSSFVNMFSGEGYLGSSDSCQNGICYCYDPKEEWDPVTLEGRGSTWALHLIQGNFQVSSSNIIMPTLTPTTIPTVTPTPTPIFFPDFLSLFRNYYNQPNPPATVDLNNNGRVDIFDYHVFVGKLGK